MDTLNLRSETELDSNESYVIKTETINEFKKKLIKADFKVTKILLILEILHIWIWLILLEIKILISIKILID